MERRKFLIGAGSAAVGTSALIGSGAFTSVQADRELSIEVAGDADAFLSISRASNDNGVVYKNAEEYVDTDENGVVSIDLTEADETDGSTASGINRNAKTIFDNLIDITNNGSQQVELWAESDLIADEGGFLGIYAENEQGNSDDNSGLSSSEKVTLEPGDAATNIGIYIPKDQDFDQVEGGTLTFIAERTDGNRD